MYKRQHPKLLSDRICLKFYRKLTHKSTKIYTEPIIIRPSEILVTKIRSYLCVTSNCQNRKPESTVSSKFSRCFTNH